MTTEAQRHAIALVAAAVARRDIDRESSTAEEEWLDLVDVETHILDELESWDTDNVLYEVVRLAAELAALNGDAQGTVRQIAERWEVD